MSGLDKLTSPALGQGHIGLPYEHLYVRVATCLACISSYYHTILEGH